MVNWDAAPEANVYRVGWIVFEDYEAAINDGRNWLEAFVFVDVDNRGQSSHTVIRLQPGVRYYFIVGSAAMRFGSAEWPSALVAACGRAYASYRTTGAGRTVVSRSSNRHH